MVFDKRLAKIGKGFNVNIYPKNQTDLSVFLYNNSMQEKWLKINKERYELEMCPCLLGCHEILKLKDNLYVSRIDNNVELVKLNEI